MSRSGWAGVMVVSLLASGASGYYVFTQMQPKAPAVNVPPLPTPELPAEPVLENKPEPAEPASVAKPLGDQAATRNILFRLPKPAAKSVSIIGDFNNWKRQSLEKKAKGWEITLALKPGSYEYMYVVEDKRMKDPNNKNVHDGKSVIHIKPLQ